MKNEFQYRLLKAIAEKNISASELSRLSGVGKSDISNYINGVYVAKQDKCYMLASALDVDPGWLMTGEEPLKATSFEKACNNATYLIQESDLQRLDALHQNPRLCMLFDRSRKMTNDDVDFMIQMADRILKERDM